MSAAAITPIGLTGENSGRERNPLIRKLSNFADLQPGEISILNGLLVDVRPTPAKRDIVSEGRRTEHVHLLVDGWAARYNVLDDGRRQISAVILPGDFCDLDVMQMRQADPGIVALTHCKVAWIGGERFDRVTAEHPLLARILWRGALLDQAILRAWVVNLGRRDAYERVAHLLCELYCRALGIGLATDDRFDLPLTQTELADATGLTSVHVNRTLQRLRADKLIELSSRILTISDVSRLQQVAGFDPAYLQIGRRAG